jgi:hypothetical protein
MASSNSKGSKPHSNSLDNTGVYAYLWGVKNILELCEKYSAAYGDEKKF